MSFNTTFGTGALQAVFRDVNGVSQVVTFLSFLEKRYLWTILWNQAGVPNPVVGGFSTGIDPDNWPGGAGSYENALAALSGIRSGF